MPYTITQRRSFFRPSWIGLHPIYPILMFAAIAIQIRMVTKGPVSPSLWGLAFLLSVPFLIGFALRFVRWRSARAEAKRTDEEWDAFVNAGSSIRPDQSAVADPARWLASSLPVLGESSRPAQWLESLEIPFQQPQSLTMQTPAQARHFAASYETAALGKITTQIADGVGAQGSGGLTAIGRVVLHGKQHCVVFRQPTEDTMIFFLFRVEVVGTVASILCGGTHFIRRAAATGDKARRESLSDDDVATVFLHPFARSAVHAGVLGFIPYLGIVGLSVGGLALLFGSPFGTGDDSYSWWRRGELACWQLVDKLRKSGSWPGLQPDRTAALAELDYMMSMLQHDILREMQATSAGMSASSNPAGPEHPPADSDGDKQQFL